jgi:uncharacterized membrane protein
MQINGLPLHPLVVHAAVIFTPVAVLAALAFLVPRWRLKLRWPMVGLALIATASVVAAYLTGVNFLDHKPELRTSPQVQTHRDRGVQLLWVTIAFGVVALASGWFATRTGAPRVALDVLLAIAAIATLVLVFLTGEAGARAVGG